MEKYDIQYKFYEISEQADNLCLQSVPLYFQEIGNIPILTKQEEVELFKRIEQGDIQARNKLIESNLKLVISIVKSFSFTPNANDFFELIQEGNLGLLIALEHYDYTKNFKFSTYATPWIKKYVLEKMINMNHIIKLPNYIYRLCMKVKKEESKLTSCLGRNPTIQELSQEVDLPIPKVQYLKQILKQISYPILSLESSTDNESCKTEDNEVELMNFIADTSADIHSQLQKKEMLSQLYEILNFLTDSEKEVLILRYGLLDNGKKKTLSEVSNILKKSKAGVSHLEKRALDKIKHPIFRKKLASFLD